MGNHQSSESITNIKNTVITDIQNTMKSNFNNTFKTTTTNTCEQTITQITTVQNLTVTGKCKVNITNQAKGDLKCKLQQASTQDIQSNIVSSLSAAIEKNLDAELLKKLDQKAESSLGSMGNTQSSTTKTDVENTSYTNIRKLIDITVKTEIINDTIIDAKQTLFQQIEAGNISASGECEVNIGNIGISFLESEIISTAVNNVINKIADDTIIEEHIKTKTKDTVEVKQDTKSKGIGEVFESIGKMFGNILGAATGPMVIVIIGIVLVIIIFKLVGSSNPQQQFPPYLPQQFPPQQFPPQQFSPQQFSPQQFPPELQKKY